VRRDRDVFGERSEPERREVRDDVVAGADPGDTITDGLHRSRDVRPEDNVFGLPPRARADEDLAAHVLKIVEVHGRRAYADEHIVWPYPRARDVLDAKHGLGIPVRAVHDRLHRPIR
jgi:hypothetical protein